MNMYRAMGPIAYCAFHDSTSDFPEYLLRTVDRSTGTLIKRNTTEGCGKVLRLQASTPDAPPAYFDSGTCGPLGAGAGPGAVGRPGEPCCNWLSTPPPELNGAVGALSGAS